MEMEEAAFPCPLERTVAAALLLLSTSAPSRSKSIDVVACCLQSKLCNSISCSSSVISDDGSSPLGIVVNAPPDHRRGANFKIVQRSRSKTRSIIISGGSDSTISRKYASETMDYISNGESYRDSKSEELGRASKTKQPACSTRMRLMSESILVLLSLTATSEVRIRQFLGDSPDTSKALRMLLKLGKIIRSGAGGRADPYIYTLT